MKFFINGEWVDSCQSAPVFNPFDQSVVDTVPVGNSDDVETTISGAVVGAKIMRNIPGYERSLFLRRAATILEERMDELSRTISLEEGKTLNESRAEVLRSAQTLELSAEEAKRIGGELLPLDGAYGAQGKLGFTMRIPCGVVVAITPFNFPLNLVCHKVGPALAAGNSVIIKPANDTPLSSLKLVEILLEAGCPPTGISCITGAGTTVGAALCQDPRVRKISFTGSKTVGEQICKMAGLKRVTMELGSNCPVVVLPDADLGKVATVMSRAGFANAGQVCISAQRIIVHDDVYDDFLERLKNQVGKIRVGNQIQEDSDIGPMVREQDAARVESWIKEAVDEGAKIVFGGSRRSTLFQPTILSSVKPEMKVACQELFGPVVGLMRAETVEAAIAEANHSEFGLSAAIYTQDIDAALSFAREVESGNIHINGGPMWRADSMPYGGIKSSGLGKEGPRYAIEEMTELKAVVLHTNP